MRKTLKDVLAGTGLVLALGGLLTISRVNAGSWENVYTTLRVCMEANTTPLFYYNNFYK
jgi:hypothetical protein